MVEVTNSLPLGQPQPNLAINFLGIAGKVLDRSTASGRCGWKLPKILVELSAEDDEALQYQ